MSKKFQILRDDLARRVIEQSFERPNPTIESAGADDSPITGSGPEAIAADEPSWPARFRLWGRR